jgi:hypothetical protein
MHGGITPNARARRGAAGGPRRWLFYWYSCGGVRAFREVYLGRLARPAAYCARVHPNL